MKQQEKWSLKKKQPHMSGLWQTESSQSATNYFNSSRTISIVAEVIKIKIGLDGNSLCSE